MLQSLSPGLTVTLPLACALPTLPASCSCHARIACRFGPDFWDEGVLGLEFYLAILVAGAVAASINALAGGGPILTLGMLSLGGVDPRIANLTSTVALCPGQLLAGNVAQSDLRANRLGRPFVLLVLAVGGGASGALLLLLTSGSAFKAIVPWLVLAATGIYAWSGLRGAGGEAAQAGGKTNQWALLFVPSAIYGGYFGGGNSFLVLALLGLSGHGAREAGAIKNALVAAINLGAVAVFAFSGLVEWRVALALGAGGVIGSLAGVRLLARLPLTAIRLVVILFGLSFSIWMFVS